MDGDESPKIRWFSETEQQKGRRRGELGQRLSAALQGGLPAPTVARAMPQVELHIATTRMTYAACAGRVNRSRASERTGTCESTANVLTAKGAGPI